MIDSEAHAQLLKSLLVSGLRIQLNIDARGGRLINSYCVKVQFLDGLEQKKMGAVFF